MLCVVFGLSSELGSFQHMLAKLKECKKGWIKDIRQCPSVTLLSVTDYLLRSHDNVTHTVTGHIEKFSADTMRRYKTLRSYKLYTAGHVPSMTFLPILTVISVLSMGYIIHHMTQANSCMIALFCSTRAAKNQLGLRVHAQQVKEKHAHT